MNRCTEAIVDIHGIKWYYPEICVDGGVFRAKNTYTNLNFPSGSFSHTISGIKVYDPTPYSGHFYGIRKYSGLAPNLPYVINIAGKSGSSNAIEIPSEIIEIEYNKNENDGIFNDYTGFRLSSNVQVSGEFGKSIASKENLLAVGCPKLSITSGNKAYEEAGAIFLYRRNERPTTVDWPIDNYKSSWTLEKVLTLPSGMLGDYSVEEPVVIDSISDFTATKTSWFVGQDGRQFGHSVDLSINNNIKSLGEDRQEILVTGGIGAKWNRTFDDTEPSGISIGLMIFTDEFSSTIQVSRYKTLSYYDVLNSIYNKDLVFNYFSNPRIKFDVKIVICVPTADENVEDPQFPDKPSFITLKRISKNFGYPVSNNTIENTYSGIYSAFMEAFPYNNQLNSGIPPILGICIDGSQSLGRDKLEPAIDRFINFYKQYSFASGLKDSYGVQSTGIVYEYLTDGEDTNWITMSQSILNEILDTGRLVQDNQVSLFTHNIGTFNKNIKSFNVPPDSGGKVYVFEKESGSWNLIQEIRSPNITQEYHDRFGHAVSISDNGEVIAVGSPYINEAITVYERNYEERDRYYQYELLNWIQTNRSAKYASALNKYYNSNNIEELYLSLDQEDKFKSRLDSNIEEYQRVFSFDYSNMQPIGSWSFIPSEFAPTSRLGYSVDVNEDGSVVVAGAPTDSLNYYNDADVYYVSGIRNGKVYQTSYSSVSGSIPAGRILPAWSSSVNAGSAHVFESRKYYPHNKAIEYGVFGNLHKSISDNTADSGHFIYLSGIFRDKNFTTTPFNENFKIPKDVGLTFIITPAEDRLSDEIVDNIKNWLSLGDRHLVLVGNDPRWEANGLYAKSNDVINKLLEKLQSRMRIVPARNEYESLFNGYSSYNNIVPSFVPEGCTNTYVKRLPLRGSGVADIKVFFPKTKEDMPCKLVEDCTIDGGKIQIQTKCEMPLMNYGDMRAQWNESCCTNGGLLIYGYNWPLFFGSYKPACGDVAFEDKPTKNYEPIPLLVAAEKLTEEIVYPAIPEISGSRIIYETVTFGASNYYEFGSPYNNDINFSYSKDSIKNINYNSIDYNITGRTNSELFYEPSDDLGGILQAKGSPKIDIIPFLSKEEISNKGYFALEYSYKLQSSSKIVIIPTNEIESELKQGIGDKNILFYQNLVSSSKTFFGGSKIAQLNWNGYSSFADAYNKSGLRSALNSYNNLTENVSFIDDTYNVAFIAGINNQPSNFNIENLLEWLSFGNKKLIITCDGTLSSILEAQKLLNRIGLELEILKNFNGEYVKLSFGILSINQSHQTCGDYFSNRFDKKIDNFVSGGSVFYGLKLNDQSIPIAYIDSPVYDDVPKNYNINNWDINAGIVRINFPVLPGSGYKLFITTDSQDPLESQELTIDVDNASVIPSSGYPDIGSISIIELDNDRVPFVSKNISSSFSTLNCSIGTIFRDIQVANTDNINVYISCAKTRLEKDNPPKTFRLLGISGVLIPIDEKVVAATKNIPIGIEYFKISDAVEEYTETQEIIRPISTDNTKYCTNNCTFLGNQLIADGPVVAAQELEIFSSFDAGFNRSRITVISDSSMIQGRYMINENNVIPQDTYDFIRSLYPETEFFSDVYGRQFNVYNKIIAPERGSPGKYHSRGTYLGINKNFGNFSNSPSVKFDPNESNYIPKNIVRPKIPWEDALDEKEIEQIKKDIKNQFTSQQSANGSTPKFSGIIDGVTYVDAPIIGGIPSLLKDKGYDYLDFDKLPSGYPGDLFGYSVCIKGNKILIGSPFSAFASENIIPWFSGSNLHIGQDGGAGSVYMFEKLSDNNWITKRKFRPQSLMGQLSGINTYSDHFGHSVDIQNDTIIIGAPNHKYKTYYENIFEDDAAFARKNFNKEFRIPERNIFDLGLSGNRILLSDNGINAHNAGAIYVYENKITDWENKAQSWKLVEKLISNYTNPSGERFGKTAYLTRPYRTDADYTIFAGCNFASGNVSNVGAVYLKDIMLRSQNPSIPNSGAWISAKVFGDKNFVVNLNFNNIGDGVKYYASGIVIPNNNGNIFLEVSGQDPSTKGFISHRPYIESIYGHYQYGKLEETGMNLYISGGNLPISSQLPLIIDTENSAYVYNTLGLYSAVQSGTTSAGLNLFAEFPSGTSLQYLNLYTSGIGSPNDVLNLSVRGK